SPSRDIRACTVSAIVALIESVNEQSTVPYWDRARRELRYRGVLCRKYRQKALNQFVILDAFQAKGWTVDSVADPWQRPVTLNQTVKDLRNGLVDESPLDFTVEINRVKWIDRSPRDGVL